MGVNVDISTAKVTAKVSGILENALPIFTDIVRQDADYYVKVDQGTLRDSAATASDFDNGVIVYNTKYAKRQYYTGTPSKDPNIHASKRWFAVAKQHKMDDWVEQAQAIVDNGGKE